MKLQPVQSSQINAIGYDSATQKMRIEFKPGSLYEYSNVPPDLFEEFSKAPSTGSFFYKNIKPHKDKYPYERLERPKAETPAAEAQAVVHPTEPENLPDPVPEAPGA